MSPAVPIEPPSSESGPLSVTTPPPPTHDPSARPRRPFAHLRGVQWRIDLGILPSSSSSIDDLRRVTADSRRRYAALRRHLLIDPHVAKDGSNSPDPVMDNPLSQNPESIWGRFFRNAELERMVDKDLSRLYPEQGSYFQTAGCQGMLRRILLLWCLRHPECGYRQGMHELLAPLLYVLHVDVEHFFEVRKLHEDHFTDKFDGFSFHESDLTYKFDFKKFSESSENEIYALKSPALSELDPKIQAIVLLSDAYGAEGELGIVMSEKFMEHDSYCMFDALMSGAGGAVAMAEFFSPSPLGSSHSGFPPVLEASSALYHLLSIFDSSLHSHLVELGVEPQYFALRWLRVLFGREFVLEDLLIIWDEIFASDNSNISKCGENDTEAAFGVLNSSRGAYISAIAVSMILYLRSSLLATENATSCLQKLLNFPEEANLEKLIVKAKSLQALALDTNNSTPLPTHIGPYSSSAAVRGHSLSSDTISPGTVLSLVPECYWEEKWRVLHKEENHKQGSLGKQVPNRIKGWSEKVRLRLSRTQLDPPPSDIADGKKEPNSLSVRRSLLDDLAQQLQSDKNIENVVVSEDLGQKDMARAEGKEACRNSITCQNEDRYLNENTGSEENSSIFSDPASPTNEFNDQDNESGSSIESNSSIDENHEESIIAKSGRDDLESSPLPVSDSLENFTLDSKRHDDSNAKSSLENLKHDDSNAKSVAGLKEQKPSGKFQWFWKFGRNTGEGISERGGGSEAARASTSGCDRSAAGSRVADGNSSSAISKGDAMDQNMMVSLRNLGQSMLENIQVLESVFQQDRGKVSALDNLSKNALVGRGQTTAMIALKELRKISNLLSEM